MPQSASFPADSSGFPDPHSSGPDAECVYVVDDEPMVLQSIARLLETAGFRVIACASGAEFLRLFDPVGRSVVVLDDSMPDLSGMELIRQLSKRGAVCPIILLSAYDDPQIIDHARRAGVFDFLLKPFDPTLLVQRVRQALAEI